jgi:protein dithiol oxidoreductase (disulfide-forming)
MTVDRRDFLFATGAAALTGTLGGAAVAQQPAAPAEGREFRTVKPAQPTEAPDGKVEVVEFFWYGCPHCHSLEPILKDWVARLPAHVAFRKVHVPFAVVAHQQLFYTLQALGKADALNDRVFAAIHEQRQRLDKPEDMADFAARHGVERKQFLDTYNSFGVRTRMQRATQLAAGYKIDGVPSFGVNGKYVTAPSMVGSNGGALRMIELLVERERKGA